MRNVSYSPPGRTSIVRPVDLLFSGKNIFIKGTSNESHVCSGISFGHILTSKSFPPYTAVTAVIIRVIKKVLKPVIFCILHIRYYK